ncbi:hypothetical protein GE061_004215 [Apolygus lucorum]|uniref:Uncharacterized protein n=1 Tax=Apolygus lucorum TaxID=248454 RepID=A0A8S9WY10_APOLU|nr:hypothetical protein GE061_004215 [Apolygus lucorum]
MEAALVNLSKATTESEKELDKIRNKVKGIETILTKNMSFLEVKEQLIGLKEDLWRLSQESDCISRELAINDAELSVKSRKAEQAFENLATLVSGSDNRPE